MLSEAKQALEEAFPNIRWRVDMSWTEFQMTGRVQTDDGSRSDSRVVTREALQHSVYSELELIVHYGKVIHDALRS